MGQSDGSVLGMTQIFGTAPLNRGFNLVLLADGFRIGEQPAFDAACASLVSTLGATPPFNAFAQVVNLFRINVSSEESGADDPVTPEGGTGATNSVGANYNILQRTVLSSGATLAAMTKYGLETSAGALTVTLPALAGVSPEVLAEHRRLLAAREAGTLAAGDPLFDALSSALPALSPYYAIVRAERAAGSV